MRGDDELGVRGVDGCRAGWFAVSIAANREVTARLFTNAKALFGHQDFGFTAIDIPIGLPASGPRQCDVEARQILGARRSSVFPAPVRSALTAATYEAACEASVRACGKKLSQQAFAILPKIREMDELLLSDQAVSSCVREVHPEVCFTYWNRGKPMKYPKVSGFGFVERSRLVDQRFPGAAETIRSEFRGSDVADDDILDALAALWTATRLASNVAVRIGPENVHDERGLAMNIWA